MNKLVINNRFTMNAIGLLQVIYAALFISNGIGMINDFNVYLGFAIYSLLSLICLALSLWLLLPFSKCDHALKYLLFFISIQQMLFTAWIYLLTTCGDPAPIQLW